MKYLRGTGFFLTMAGCIFSIWGCKPESHQWDINVLTPLAHTELTINNVFQSPDLVTNKDSSLTVVYNINITALNMSNFLKIPDTTVKKSVNLQTINLGTRVLTEYITLGQVARNAGTAGQLILFAQGQSAAIPALSNLSSGQNQVNATSFFQTATFITGTLSLSIVNGFPVALTNIKFLLTNKVGGQTIVQDTIAALAPGQKETKTYSLAGKTVEGILEASLLNMSTPGSNGNDVKIDTNNALALTLVASNMSVSSATAIFPAQNLVNDSVQIAYNLNGPQINYLIIKSGYVYISAESSINDSLFLHYVIPTALLNGSEISVNRTVLPAKANDTSRVVEVDSLNGASIDLRGRYHNSHNILYNILNVRIDSTGKLENLSLNDSVYLDYGLYKLIPYYARGYLGKGVYTVGPSTTYTTAFNTFQSGNITLNNLSVSVALKNGIGADGEVTIKSIKATNSKTGVFAYLDGPVMQKQYFIPRATDNPFTPSVTNITLNSSNSNIVSLVSILPNRFDYTMQVNLNPYGNISNYNDFIYDFSTVVGDMQVQAPLYTSVQGLTIEDTVSIDLSPQQQNLQQVSGGTLYMYATNGFPFTAVIQAYVLDPVSNEIVDSLLLTGQNIVQPATLNSKTGIVSSPTVTQFSCNITGQRWQRLFTTRKLILKATLATWPVNKNIKIYDYYKLGVKFSALFKYQVNQQ